MTQRATDAHRTKYVLDEADLPTQWYNIQADLKTPAPPVLHPGTGQPIGPQDLAPLFPMALIAQEVSQERWIDIPEEVRDVLRLWRPSPLYRARRLERALDTPARIYYKYEGVSPAEPQAQHRGGPGLLQQAGRGDPAQHRNRRRAVGLSPGYGLRLLWPGVQGLYGQDLVQPKALPPRDDGDLGGAGGRQPELRDAGWAHCPGAGPGLTREPGDCHQ